jgi:hypothetical protein
MRRRPRFPAPISTRWLGCALALASGGLPLAAGAEDASRQALPGTVPALLADAFKKLMDNQGHWAFTQTQAVSGLTAALGRDTVLKVDPSRIYAEQFTPLTVEGRPPTAGERDEFKALGERIAKRRLREKQESSAGAGDELKIHLNSQVVTPDLAHASVASENAGSVTYVIPLRSRGSAGSSAFDQFEVTARVNKQRREFEHATFRQRSTMRVEMVAKVSDAVIDCEFTSVDPAYPSVITRETEQATVRILFVRRVVGFAMRREGFRRVTPYDERFGVKVGPLRTLEF